MNLRQHKRRAYRGMAARFAEFGPDKFRREGWRVSISWGYWRHHAPPFKRCTARAYWRPA